MAALSTRGRDDVDSFIRAFAGTNRFILDFLVEEVLSREPEEVQTFLLQTAILARLAGPLCDAVTGASGGQEMLERLERRNLFVVPLDDERRWASRAPLARAELLALKARILVRQGSLTEAARCVEEAVHLAGRHRGQTGEMVALAAARVLLAQSKPDEAVAQLTRSLAAAEGCGRLGVALETRILRSLALARQRDTREAEADLERALALAEPEGYVRVFIDEGEPMADLLRKLATRAARTSGSGAYSAQYLATLLAAFGAPGDSRPSAGSSQAGGTGLPSGTARPSREEHSGRSPTLIEALSERERQVLRLMAEGLTNEQIAAKLIIALGTVKAHIHNISGKLGAQNRAHAVVRAKELGLL